MKDLVSICIPVYNGAEFLRQCLDSVLTQTYQHVEVIIVDDCSTDNSPEIIQSYLPDNHSIRYVRNQTNLGLVGNWNSCIELSKGEWIKFVFQDDMIEENCIEVFLQYCKKNQTPLLVSKRRFLTGGSLSAKMEKYYEFSLPTLSRIKVENVDDFISPRSISNAAVSYMAMNIIGEPTVSFFRKSITGEIGLYDDRLDQICDLEYLLRIATKYGLIYVPVELTSFRIHASSVSSRNIASKYYRLSNLDPVKLAHLLLFSDTYRDFRSNLTKFNSLKLRLYFNVRSLEARSKAAGNQSWLKEFKEAEDLFPEMAASQNPGIIVRLIYFIISLKRILNNIAGR